MQRENTVSLKLYTQPNYLIMDFLDKKSYSHRRNVFSDVIPDPSYGTQKGIKSQESAEHVCIYK